jgi:predicted transport protein
MAVYVKYTIDDKIICTISGNNSKLKMCFNVDIDELSDPYNLLEDVSQKGHHGIGNSRIVFNDNSHIDEITDFVKQVISII